jgi:2-desacetyl-2-hydroxyethyl bacteriochlorophyllide A dehydrogenase
VAETYKRSVFVGPRQIRIDEVPIPEPGPSQVLVKVKCCAICTWEQRTYVGEEKFYPLAGGHEVSGEVVKLGKFVYSDAQVGDRVMASTLTRCGFCESCRKGYDNICDNSMKKLKDTDVAGPGGLSEYVLIEGYQLYKATNDISFEELCLAEPLACVIRSVRQAKVERADNVVVVGAGIMGMLHLLLCKQAGARVFVSEPNPVRAEFALKMGADAIIDPVKESFLDRVKVLTNGRGADHIFCAVSIAAAVEQAVEAAAKGGRVAVYASIHPRGTKIAVDPNIFHNKEVILSGTVSQDKEDVLQSVRMIATHRIDLKPFVSLVMPFDQLVPAIEAALRPDTYRVVVSM